MSPRTPRRKSPQKSGRKHVRKQGKLRGNAPAIDVEIEYIGHRGDGIGHAEYTHLGATKTYKIFVPDSAEGDRVKTQPIQINSHGIQTKLLEVIAPSDDRKTPDCGASPACGGCQFQHLETGEYQSWKDKMVRDALKRADITPKEWRTTYSAPTSSRRRARFVYRRLQHEMVMGFRERSSHQIIPIDDCIILAPELIDAYDMARTQLLMVLEVGQTGELDINLCTNGWDMTIHPDDKISYAETTNLITAASQSQITRLSMADGNYETSLVYLNQHPQLTWPLPEGARQESITLHPAPSTFLQAEPGAEMVMKEDVYHALTGCEKVVDLFCGSGTLSLPLLFQQTPPKTLAAYDTGEAAIQSMVAVAKSAGLSQRLLAERRNLVEIPLGIEELNYFDAAIVDPPRGGAAVQMPNLAASTIPRIIMVSCNPQTFARDAAELIKGGYQCSWARHVDQFYLTAHAEIVACFDKAPTESIFEGSMFT